MKNYSVGLKILKMMRKEIMRRKMNVKKKTKKRI
jgi:hypothetical protein